MTFVFNGQRFNVGVPVLTDVKWNAYRFGYEWDFLYKSRGFAGVLARGRSTPTSTATLTSTAVGAAQFTAGARADPGARRSSAAATSCPTSRSPASSASSSCPTRRSTTIEYSGKYYDFDLYGTVNFTDHVGAQVGYRSFDVFYKVKRDTGTMTLKGLYIGGVARF